MLYSLYPSFIEKITDMCLNMNINDADYDGITLNNNQESNPSRMLGICLGYQSFLHR